MREIAIERPACRYAKTRGWHEIKMKANNRRGYPDRLFIRNGVYLWIEFKAPGEEPTKQQSLRHRELLKAGAHVVAVDNLERAYALLY